MRPCDDFESLRAWFDAVAEELKHTEDCRRRHALINCVSRIIGESHVLVGQMKRLCPWPASSLFLEVNRSRSINTTSCASYNVRLRSVGYTSVRTRNLMLKCYRSAPPRHRKINQGQVRSLFTRGLPILFCTEEQKDFGEPHRCQRSGFRSIVGLLPSHPPLPR